VASRYGRVKKALFLAVKAVLRSRRGPLRAESRMPEPGTTQALALPAVSPVRSDRSA
jgi:hypothetical protein